MKRWIALCLLALTLFSLTACRFQYMTPEEMHDFMDGLTQKLGQSQITEETDLIGNRCLNGDGFTGGYRAECEGNTGRDVVFGGASIDRRCIQISGVVETVSGTAQIRIRMNDQTMVLDCDADGNFQTVLSMDNGGNYIMVDYDQFVGRVELDSAYVQTSEDGG